MDSFFIKLIIDGLQNKFEEIGYDDDAFDALFIDKETGVFLSDENFFANNGSLLCNDEMYSFVYSVIVDNFDNEECPFEFPPVNIICEIIKRFIIYNYDNKELANVYKILNELNINQIINLFLNDNEFGLGLMNGVYTSIIDNNKYNKNKAKIIKDKKGSLLTKFMGEVPNGFMSINDILRNIVCDLYNYYISIGSGDIDALNCTWAYFTNDMDPIGVLDNLCSDSYSKENLKKSILNIIFSDLYEDALNNPIIDSENYDDRLADFIPVFCLSFGFVNIPNNKDIRNRLLKHFILLQDEKEKLKDNRIKTYEEGRQLYLKKVNPTYELDDYNFLKNKNNA